MSVSFLPSAPGSAQGSLSLTSKQGSVPISLAGTGIQPAISVTPASVSFGNVSVGVTSSQTITLSNSGSASLDVTQFTAPSAGFSMTGLNAPLTLTPGQTAKFSVSFTPGTVGSQASSVTLFSNAPTSPVRLSLSGAGVKLQPQISVLPGSLAFGSVNVGSSGKQSLTVSNPGSTALSISAANMTRADFATVGLSLPMTIAAG